MYAEILSNCLILKNSVYKYVLRPDLKWLRLLARVIEVDGSIGLYTQMKMLTMNLPVFGFHLVLKLSIQTIKVGRTFTRRTPSTSNPRFGPGT